MLSCAAWAPCSEVTSAPPAGTHYATITTSWHRFADAAGTGASKHKKDTTAAPQPASAGSPANAARCSQSPSTATKAGKKKGSRLQPKKGQSDATEMDVDESLLDDVGIKAEAARGLKHSSSEEEQLPFLQEDAYYPTLLPFQRVEELHDSEALSRHVIPTDLAELEVCLHLLLVDHGTLCAAAACYSVVLLVRWFVFWRWPLQLHQVPMPCKTRACNAERFYMSSCSN